MVSGYSEDIDHVTWLCNGEVASLPRNAHIKYFIWFISFHLFHLKGLWTLHKERLTPVVDS